ncbi:MAG: 16S rRNA (cytosine(1402)-N(4))-methyltransferase [Verrucomicrobia bacterium]|nr:16S rRNA (cytosine(1402)-N(4))-methyltransferase [Verrucomicrobiota bacterium]
MEVRHRPVLLARTIELLAIRSDGIYVDGTAGGGGHAQGVLERLSPDGFLLGMDRDAAAVERLNERFARWRTQCAIVQGNFADMVEIANRRGIRGVDGILLDLGVSSDQIEQPDRGFSFMKEGPLDMRMDSSQSLTAADVVNTYDERRLGGVLREFGEEPQAGRIARAIAQARARSPIRTTTEFAAIVEKAAGGRRGRIHPATRTFQAIRIETNGELENLRRGLEAGIGLLNMGGRFAVISFHSLEDRIVKRFFAGHAGRWESLQAGGRKWVGEEPAVRFVNRKHEGPAEDELCENPRSRSAKLRVVERTERPED